MQTALALGTFDGVHRGHRAVLDLPRQCKKVAVIFARPPKAEKVDGVKLIMTYEDKCRALKNIGMDEIVTLDFRRVCNLSPQDFLSYLQRTFSPAVISCGFDYRFGKDAAGDAALLQNFCKANDITLCCRPPVKEGEKVISSTMIRGLLKDGDIKAANALLSEDFSFEAVVVGGHRLGRTLGFPTINQVYPPELTPLRFGVYATEIILDGQTYRGMTDIGIRPTFETDYIISETYIHGFSGDLYGKTVRVKPLRFIRDEKKFSSINELKKQLEQDKAAILL